MAAPKVDKQKIRALDIDNAIGDLRHDLTAASAVMQAAICTRDDKDVKVLVMTASSAVTRAIEVLMALRDLTQEGR